LGAGGGGGGPGPFGHPLNPPLKYNVFD